MASDSHLDSTSANGSPDGHHPLVAVNHRLSHLPAPPWAFAGAPTRPEILTSRPTPVDLLHSLRRRWLMAVGLGMVVAGMAAAAVWILMPVHFESWAVVRISKVMESLTEGPTRGSEDFDIYKRTQQQLVKSNFVLSRSARKPDVVKLRLIQQHKDDPVLFLDNYLKVDFPGDAELMRVSLKGPYREELPKIVNAVVDAYMDEIVLAERNKDLKRRDIIERTVIKNRQEIRKKHEKFYQLAKQLETSNSNIAQVKTKRALDDMNNSMARRNELAKRLEDLDLKILLLTSRSDHPEDNQPPQSVVEAELDHDPDVQRLKSFLKQIARKKKEMVKTMRPGQTEKGLRRINEEEANLREELEDRKKELIPLLVDRLAGASMPQQAGMILPLLQKERELLSKGLDQATAALDKKMDDVAKLEANSSELEAQKQELDELIAVTRTMSTHLRKLNLDLENPARVTFIERATMPIRPDATPRYIAVSFAAAAGFGLILFGVAFLEFQGRRVNSASDVRDGLGISVVGELPPLSGRNWKRIRSGSTEGGAMQAALSEAIDSIRTTLIHTTIVDSPRVVMITSAEAQEGKTTTATQLAASLARSGRRTLLVDGDLRNPAAHRVFELRLEPGFCEVLRGEVEHDVAPQPTHTPNLWLLSAGRCDMTSVQILSQDVLAKLVATLKSEYDFVIIDSGPVLKVADPLSIGQHVDAAVLSVLRDISRVPNVYEVLNRLNSVGITVLGAVVNGIRARSKNYYGAAAALALAPAEVEKSASLG